MIHEPRREYAAHPVDHSAENLFVNIAIGSAHLTYWRRNPILAIYGNFVGIRPRRDPVRTVAASKRVTLFFEEVIVISPPNLVFIKSVRWHFQKNHKEVTASLPVATCHLPETVQTNLTS